MWHQRFRNTGFALIGAAFSLVAWKSVVAGSRATSHGEALPTTTGSAVLTIPVEIVEAGEAPRLHEVRVTP
jgi:hypothetical protein